MTTFDGSAAKRISMDMSTCMQVDRHPAHWWAYTSDDGGHMAEVEHPEWYGDHRMWLCPGVGQSRPSSRLYGRTI